MTKEAGMLSGVAINPATSINVLENILYLTDLVCIMSVNPGFGGQKFIDNTYNKLNQLNDLISERVGNHHKILIEIDGGVTLENAELLRFYEADILVAGNTIFNNENPKNIINELKNI